MEPNIGSASGVRHVLDAAAAGRVKLRRGAKAGGEWLTIP
jgi:hypothetical protein